MHRRYYVDLLRHKPRFSSLLCGTYMELGHLVTELGMGGARIGDRRTPKFWLGNPDGKSPLRGMSLNTT